MTQHLSGFVQCGAFALNSFYKGTILSRLLYMAESCSLHVTSEASHGDFH